MARHEHIIPDVLIPPDDICVPLYLPHDLDYISIFLRQIRQLELDRMYQRDENKSALIVREQWRERTINPLIDALADGTPCGGGDDGIQCFDVPTTNVAFEFYPNDPYTDTNNDNGTTILSGLRWVYYGAVGIADLPFAGEQIEAVLSNITGYFPSDAFLFPDVTDSWLNPIDRLGDLVEALTNFFFPYVKFTCDGAVEVEIDLVKVPFGCAAIIIPDLDLSFDTVKETIIEFIDNDGDVPNFWRIVELNRDLVSVPPELDVIEKQEITFDSEGEHTIHIIFVPRLNDEIPFLNPFGGIRKIEVCGGNLVNPETGEPITPIDYGDPINIKDGVITVSTVTDICNGVICAMEKAASRFLSGQAGNVVGGVTIGTDGDIVIDSGGGVGGIGASHNGGSSAVISGLYEMFDQFETWKDAVVSATMTASQFKLYAKAKYKFSGDIDTAIDNLLAEFTTTSIWYTAFSNGTEYLYCSGATKQNIVAWILDNTPVADTDNQIEIINALDSEQIDDWYNSGTDIPLTDYLGFECYIREPIVAVRDAASYLADETIVKTGTNWVFSGNRYIKLTVTGKFISETLQREHDIFYQNNLATETITLNKAGWELIASPLPPGRFLYPATNPPYNENGNYEWVVIVDSNDFGNFTWVCGNYANNADVVGEMTITLTDLGAVT